MATGGFIQELTDFVSCEICNEQFTDNTPRVLSCMHVSCEDCLQSLLDIRKNQIPNNPDIIDCPVCRKETNVLGGLASNLPLEFRWSKIEDLRKGFQERHLKCQICLTDTHKSDISSICNQCRKGMCDKCRVNHDQFYKNHTPFSVAPAAVRNMICQDHHTYVDHYCTSCCKGV